MADFNFGHYNPYRDAASALHGPANTLFSIMSELPRQRAQAAEMLARTGLLTQEQQTSLAMQKVHEATIPELTARTGLIGAQTAETNQKMGFATQRAEGASELLPSLGQSNPAAQRMLGGMVGGTINPQEAMHALGSLALMMGASQPAQVSAGTFGPTPDNRSIGEFHTPTVLGPDASLLGAFSGTNAPQVIAHAPKSFDVAHKGNLDPVYMNGISKINASYQKEAADIVNQNPKSLARIEENRKKALSDWDATYQRLLPPGLPSASTGTNRVGNIKSITRLP